MGLMRQSACPSVAGERGAQPRSVRATVEASVSGAPYAARFQSHARGPRNDHEQQVGPQHVLPSGLRARMKALATFPSTCGAIVSASMPLPARNDRASSVL